MWTIAIYAKNKQMNHFVGCVEVWKFSGWRKPISQFDNLMPFVEFPVSHKDKRKADKRGKSVSEKPESTQPVLTYGRGCNRGIIYSHLTVSIDFLRTYFKYRLPRCLFLFIFFFNGESYVGWNWNRRVLFWLVISSIALYRFGMWPGTCYAQTFSAF